MVRAVLAMAQQVRRSTAMWLTSAHKTRVDLARRYSTIDSEWRRPTEVSFPKVWRHCSGKMKVADSTVTQFRIQDAPEEMFDEVIEHMTSEMLNDEPMFSALRMREDTTSVQELQAIWREMLEQRVSLVVLVEDSAGRAHVAGCNVLGVVSSQSHAKQHKVTGKPLRRILDALDQMGANTNVFTQFGVSHYLTGFGLCVARAFRGQGLGKELLHARLDLCRTLRLPLTVTLFSGPASQAVAHTLGMELLEELPYEKYLPGGKPGFPGVSGTMKLMAKRIQ